MVSSVDVSLAAYGDIPAIVEFIKASWARTYDPVIGVEARKAKSDAKHVPALFKGEIDRPDAMGIVAKNGDAVIGYVGGEMRGGDVFFIDHLHVDPAWQGRKVAAEILKYMRLELAQHLKPRCIELTVLENNYRAVAFYKKTGFVEAKGANEDEGLGGVPSILMRWEF